jgi:cell division septation protein DedD
MDHQLIATDKQQQIMLLTQQDLAKQRVLLTPDIAIAPTTDKKPPPADVWNVNLGSFQNKKEAIALQQKVQAAGYQTTIQTLTAERITTHKLAIAGFADQDSAEAAARNLMDKIDLDSIWVWKDE